MPKLYQPAPLTARLILAGLAALLGGAALAHDGHIHADDAKPAVSAPVAPRGDSTSDTFELVAVARGGVLTIYLDRTPTNEPVTAATIQADTPGGHAEAAAQADGTFRLDAPWSRAPGSYELTFTVETPDGAADVFPVTLDVPAVAATVEPHNGSLLAVVHDMRHHLAARDPVGFALLGGGAVLGAALAFTLRRRPRRELV